MVIIWVGQTIWGLVPFTPNYEFKYEPSSFQEVQTAACLLAVPAWKVVVAFLTGQT